MNLNLEKHATHTKARAEKAVASPQNYGSDVRAKICLFQDDAEEGSWIPALHFLNMTSVPSPCLGLLQCFLRWGNWRPERQSHQPMSQSHYKAEPGWRLCSPDSEHNTLHETKTVLQREGVRSNKSGGGERLHKAEEEAEGHPILCQLPSYE